MRLNYKSLTLHLTLTSFTALAVGLPSLAQATNGYFQPGYGARQVGIAGSGVAFPQDAMISAINPAGVVFVGKRRDIGLTVFSPRRKYTVSGNSPPPPGGFPPFAGPTVDSDSEWFFIPDLAFSWPISDNKAAIGFSLYGNGGMNTDYPANRTPFNAGTFGAAAVPGADTRTGVDYSQLFANLSYSRKFADDKASWGVSVIGNISRLEMVGMRAFAPFSVDPANLSDNGHDTATGVGARLGIQAQLTPGFALGLSYQTKIKNTFDDYAGLFANGGKLDIPQVAQGGVAFKAGPGTLTADVQYIDYPDSEAVGNTTTQLTTSCMPSRPFTNAPVASGPGCLGNGLGFGWDDMTVFKFGYTWETSGGWTWRVGASTGNQPIPSQEVTFNIIAPGVMEEHFTFGFSKKLGGKKELNIALLYAPEKCVSGPDLFTPGKTVELCMEQLAGTIGLSF